MTAATKRTPAAQPVSRERDQVPKSLQDRIPADGEQVEHVLDPDRTPDTVRYPDPDAPVAPRDRGTVAPQSNAEVQMGRRTDAGPAVSPTNVAPATSPLLIWGAVATGLFLVVAALIALT